jgi:arabinogalactan endo-1,4-beta-galactosidase
MLTLNNFTGLAFAGALSLGMALNADATKPRELWLGADISGTTADEARGVFSTDTLGVVTENTQLMKNYGMNAVRLRVWVNPRGGWSSKEDVLTMAQRAKALGMEIMIDFHYSDWWADPEKQIPPEAWKNLDLEGMKKALANHTAETLQLLKDNGINVKWVQVGNETRNGFLWPMGKLSEGNMANYAALTAAGYDAVKSVYPEAAVIVHIDNGFDNATYNEIFDGLKANGAKWDIIGMSVYPYWAMLYNHEPDAESTLRDAIDNIRKLHAKYGCDIMIVETGVEASKPDEGLAFMNEMFDAVINDADGACTGVFYWAPEMFQTVGPDGNLHGYSLGAFENGHPTSILNSYPRAAALYSQPE